MQDNDLITLDYKDIFDSNKTKKIQFSASLLKEPYKEKSLFTLLVDGKSMEPKINDRALLISDLSQKEIIDGGIYIIYKDDRLWVKKAVQTNVSSEFVSINKDFSHLIYNANDVHVVAKVLLTFTTF